MLPKEGSHWIDKSGKLYHIIHVVEVNGKMWVHYEEDGCDECHEYSCWVDSFLDRFTETSKQY